jgi:hypothetical protein
MASIGDSVSAIRIVNLSTWAEVAMNKRLVMIGLVVCVVIVMVLALPNVASADSGTFWDWIYGL